MPRIGSASVNTIEYWDRVYREGRYPTLAPNNIARYRAAALFQLGDTALDVGCGQAGLGYVLLQLFPNVHYHGWDYSSQALWSTVLEGEGWELYHGTFEDMAERQGPCDTVYLCDVLEHVDEPSELLALVASLAKQRIVVSVPRYQALTYEMHRGEHAWDFTEDEIHALLAVHSEFAGVRPAGSLCLAFAYDIKGGLTCAF